MTHNLDNDPLQEVQALLEGPTMQDFGKIAKTEGYCNLRNAEERQNISAKCAFKMVQALDGHRLHFDNEHDYTCLLVLLLAIMEDGCDGEFMA